MGFPAKKPAGKYDTATQTIKKPAAPKASGGSKGGFAGKGSTIRPLTAQEHQAAADHLAAAGQHHASAHHRSAAEQMQGQQAPADNDNDADDQPQPKGKAPMQGI